MTAEPSDGSKVHVFEMLEFSAIVNYSAGASGIVMSITLSLIIIAAGSIISPSMIAFAALRVMPSSESLGCSSVGSPENRGGRDVGSRPLVVSR
jgi:hypothetical protein